MACFFGVGPFAITTPPANNARLAPQRWPRQNMTDLYAVPDGLAPAVEMGASRLRALSLRDRIDRFDDRFDTAKARARCTIERHQC